MIANVLITTKDMTHEQWLEARKAGIGGSDAAAIAGLNKWSSPIGVYYDKTNEIPKEQLPNEAAYFGNVLEEIVAVEFSRRTELKVRKCNAILQHPEYPWMLANVDRLIVGEELGLECKTASEYLKKEWDGDEIPASYLIQCQHYMAVTGYKAWWIAVLIGGNKFLYKKIDRDEEVIQYLIDIEKDFWLNHIEKQIPPSFDGSDASTKLLKQMYPEGYDGSEVDLPSKAKEHILSIKNITEQIKELETQKKERENKLKAMIGDKEKGVIGDHKATWKNVYSQRFDTKRFKEKHPELYEEFAKESVSRRFSIN
ncbi:hypothetical protein COF59_08275 [Bacillus pseudomycoides]|uniref:YqaJ viral recombinase family nuclease n=1 Tax=Bacillus pseudomycoides TaxID=64104 RepID=UPI000BFE6D94|nr:YqaJ viral recombinase family protein [Bacillus pseudomycoides]PHE19215.1 hypothetical protein COF59_08275 [Bacillus pseudomycoides]